MTTTAIQESIMMTSERLEELLAEIANVGVAVIGDFCIDAYWTLEPGGSEVSVETGKPAHAVRAQHYGLGGAGNVVQNLVDLGTGRVVAIGVLGDDLFGREMLRIFRDRDVVADGMVTQPADWATPVYAKPYIGEAEEPRFDWGTFNAVAAETEDRLVEALTRAVESVGAVVINQQLPKGGPYRGGLIAKLNAVIAQASKTAFIVDSRDFSDQFTGTLLKVNDIEAARLSGDDRAIGETVSADDVRRYAEALYATRKRPLFITRGARGIMTYDGTTLTDVSGLQLMRATDPVGAGDTCVSAIAASLAAGATTGEAAAMGNFASAVSVQKLRQTGTASPDEVLEIGADPDFVHRPELAASPRHACFVDDSEIEVVDANVERGNIQHALFDHDGTISTLRQGWERIMAPVCVKAILGEHHDQVGDAEFQRVVEQVDDYIDKSTGIQTIIQMDMLVEMVREAGYVPADRVLDTFGYKEIYNDALMEMVDARLAKFRRGELSVDEFTVKGAVAFLHALRDRGVKLYLASGTDRDDVLAETEALGYADLFDGRIHGAVGDVSKYSKKMVVADILRDNDLHGTELVCFGDGPVELRETQKAGGIAVGVASDEIRRFGRDDKKRERLIRAGAHALVPDFSQGKRLLAWLFSDASSA
jgi:rfaE bifunctional protein kinase chain/domain